MVDEEKSEDIIEEDIIEVEPISVENSVEIKPGRNIGHTIAYYLLYPIGYITGKINKEVESLKGKLREYHVISQDPEKRDYIYEVQIVSTNIDNAPERHHKDLKETVEKHLARYGGSIVINYQEPMINVHVHTNEPDLVLEYLIENVSGNLKDTYIANLDDQINHMEEYYKKMPIDVDPQFLDKHVKLMGEEKIGISSESLSRLFKKIH